FVSRLLESEGIGYHVDNGGSEVLLVLADNDGGRARLAPAEIGPAVQGREVLHFQLGGRIRPGTVILGEYNWKKPLLDLTAEATGAEDKSYVEYHYPGGYLENAEQGKPLATARLDRYHVEANYAVGEGRLRLLSAGSIFKLIHEDADKEGEYLVTELHL